jgi:hypothetical protein
VPTQGNSWKPTPRQEEFLSLPDDIFEALFGGQAGGGKSEILLMLPIAREFYKHPRFKGLILRRTSPELEREIIVRSQVDGFYKACGGEYNGQHKRWQFPSGAIIQFGHFEYEKDAKIYDTAQYNYIAFDEVTSFTPYQYEYLTYSRCRNTTPGLPSIVRCGTNPGGVSHNYFRKRFVEPFRDGGKVIRETKVIDGKPSTVKLIFIKSKATDNPYLMKTDPGYLDRMQRLPEAERIAKALGDWWIYSGQVFDDFREQRILSEPENALHVIAPFNVPYFWPKLLSIDWGFDAMTHALFWAINPLPDERFPAKIYVYREYAAKREKISTWAGNLRKLSHGEDIKDIVLDPSAFGHRGDEKTIDEQFADSFGRPARRADNDRIGGKLLIQEYLRWKFNAPRIMPSTGYDVDAAIRIRRIGGDEAVREYEKTFLVDEDEGYLPKLQIFDTCKELINCIPLCTYDKDHPEDVSEFSGDDPYDNFRYGLKACQYFLTSNISQANQEEQRARIMNNFAQTNNMTALHMNMDKLERTENKLRMPIARRRHGRFQRKG